MNFDIWTNYKGREMIIESFTSDNLKSAKKFAKARYGSDVWLTTGSLPDVRVKL